MTAERAVQFAGRLGIPADAAAVAVSITVTGATAPGFLRVWPDGTTQPTTAVMNFPAASGITNNALVRPGTSGSVRVAAYGGCAHVIIDAVGYYTSGAPVASGLVTIAPTRLADTRSPGAGGCVTGERPIQIADRSGIPSNATAVAVNVTVTGATAPGFLRLWPNGESQPASALVNYQAAVGISNGTAAKVGTSSSIRVWASGGCPHVIVDAVGYYTSGTSGPGAFVPIAPRRALDTRAPGSGGCVVGERELVVSPWNQASGGVPAGAAAVTLNVTIPDATDAGFLRVWPGRSPQPGAAAMNYQARSGISNGTTVRVGDDGSVRFWASGGCPHVIVDVVGYTVG